MSYRTEDQRAPYKRAHAHYKAHLPFYLLKAFSQADRHPSTIDELCESLLPEVLARDKNVGFPIRSRANNVRRWIINRPHHEETELKCRYKDDVPYYVNGAVWRNVREKIKLEKHMYSCVDCQEMFTEYFGFRDFFRRSAPQPTDSLRKRIIDRSWRRIMQSRETNKKGSNLHS